MSIKRLQIGAIATVLSTAMLLSGCAGQVTTATATSSTVGKYDQTWVPAYKDTTCADWNDKMTEHQRWVAAGDMLYQGRKIWNIDAIPSDTLIDVFEGDISQGCEPSIVVSESITDTATSLLLIGGKAQYGG